MDIVKVFGDNLKILREARCLSQEKFADLCGLHRTYISAVECQRRNVSIKNVQRIADALNVEAHILLIETTSLNHNKSEKN